MENLQQIIVQENTSEYKRALAQYGDNMIFDIQKEIIYSELTNDEKIIYDNFITMIKSK
jgi:hypothetical protein